MNAAVPLRVRRLARRRGRAPRRRRGRDAAHRAAREWCAPQAVDGLLYGRGADQLLKQVVAVAPATLVYSFVVTTVLALVIQKTIGFRIDPEHETTGVDLVVHGETAYDLHVATSGARPHLGG